MTTPIDIRADHLRIVHDVLARHLPDGVKVWVFGSRATWATKDSSDLDPVRVPVSIDVQRAIRGDTLPDEA